MSFAGDAIWAMGVMWFLVALVLFFLILRIYTRIVCVASYGVDDHIYAVAFVFLLIFTIFTHLAASNGFGQTMQAIANMDNAVQATRYEYIGQSFAILGMAVAKGSLGFFLLRLISVPWHKIPIWVAMIGVGLASVAQVLCFWLSCVPREFVYDRRIPGGHCPIDTRPTLYIVYVATLLADFFFAIFPSVIVWNLQMPRREKMTIVASFSLGLLAAAAGIRRTTEVEGLYTEDYLKDSVGLIVWSAVEMAVTLVCIGIPVCRPLFHRVYNRVSPHKHRSEFEQHDDEEEGKSIMLRTIGGAWIRRDGKVETNATRSWQQDGDMRRAGHQTSTADNTEEEEEILGPKFRQREGGQGGDGMTGSSSQLSITVPETSHIEHSQC